jgi:hypothetical protein
MLVTRPLKKLEGLDAKTGQRVRTLRSVVENLSQNRCFKSNIVIANPTWGVAISGQNSA